MKAIQMAFSLVVIPISMYIQYSLLRAVNADRLLMFLFWVELPLLLGIGVLNRIIDSRSTE